jgi:hypothetical protein
VLFIQIKAQRKRGHKVQNLKRFFSGRIFKWLFNDYAKIVFIACISLRLYYILKWEIFSGIQTRPIGIHTLKLASTIPFIVFFLILGTILAIILQKGLLLKSLLAGSVVSLLILFNFPLFRFYFGFNVYGIHRYFAILAFPLSAAMVIITGFKKRISAFARDALAVVLGLVFIAGLGQWIFSVYQFRSSTSYKNSISFEMPVYPGSFDIQSKVQRSTGLKGISFKKEAAYLSYDLINYCNEFLRKKGFAIETEASEALWFKNEGLGPDYYLGRRYISQESQLSATISLHQEQAKSTNIQNFIIQVCPNLEKYERFFSKYRKTTIDKSTIEWLVLANFQFYAEKPLDRYSPTAREWFSYNFSNKNPSVLKGDFDGNGLNDAAVLACPAPGKKTADIFAIFSQEIPGCFRKIYSKEAPDDSFILPVAKGTVLNFGEGAGSSTPQIPMAHDAIALSHTSGNAVVYYWQPALKTFGSIPIESDRIIEFIKKRG